MSFYLVTLQATHGVSENAITRTFAISEEPENFWLRNANDLESCVILCAVPVSHEFYTVARTHNPPDRENYWRLSDNDAQPPSFDDSEDLV